MTTIEVISLFLTENGIQNAIDGADIIYVHSNKNNTLTENRLPTKSGVILFKNQIELKLFNSHATLNTNIVTTINLNDPDLLDKIVRFFSEQDMQGDTKIPQRK